MITRNTSIKPVTANESPTGEAWESVLEAVHWDGPADDAAQVLEDVVNEVQHEGHRVIDWQLALASMDKPDGLIGWLLYARVAGE